MSEAAGNMGSPARARCDQYTKMWAMQAHQSRGGMGSLPARRLGAGNLCPAVPISLHLSEQQALRPALFLHQTPWPFFETWAARVPPLLVQWHPGALAHMCGLLLETMCTPLSKLGRSSCVSLCLLILQKRILPTKPTLCVALAAGVVAASAHTGHPPTDLSPPRAPVSDLPEISPTNS